MKTYLKINIVFLSVFFTLIGCEKTDKLHPNHAEGTIIEVTEGCYGEIVLIEVNNPKWIGQSGTFSSSSEGDKQIKYSNAIGVPYFSKIGISDSVPQTVGTQIYFEYRELSEAERGLSSLFSPDPSIACPFIYGPPSVTYYMLTKIFWYK